MRLHVSIVSCPQTATYFRASASVLGTSTFRAAKVDYNNDRSLILCVVDKLTLETSLVLLDYHLTCEESSSADLEGTRKPSVKALTA